MLTVEPFVMLGKTVPEERKDGRITVCSAGFTPDLGLVRIYPLARESSPPRWSRNRVVLERNPEDPRSESFRLAAPRNKNMHRFINSTAFQHLGDVERHSRKAMLDDGDRRFHYYVDSVGEANERRMSLAIVRPKQQNLVWTRPGDKKELHLAQMELDMWQSFAAEERTALAAKVPRIRFTDGSGDHLLQFRDWGVFEFIRKYGNDACDRMPFNSSNALLVGNILRHQTSWLVIASITVTDQMTLELQT